MPISEKRASLFDRILDGMAMIAGRLMLFVMALVCVDVVLRYALNNPLMITLPFSELTLVLVVCLGGVWLLKDEGHVTIDLLLAKLKPAYQSLLKAITSFLSAIVLLVIGLFSIPQVIELIVTRAKIVNSSSIFPRAVFALPMTIFYFLFAIQFVRRGVDLLRAYSTEKETHQ